MFLVKEPECPWKVDTRDVSLSTLQEVVGGYIELFRVPEESLCFVLNEEGRLLDLPVNVIVNGAPFVGTIAIVDTNSDDICDISQSEIHTLCEDMNALTFGGRD